MSGKDAQSKSTLFTKENILLGLSVVIVVAARSQDQVLYYRLSHNFSNYVWYLSTFMLPAAYMCIGWPVVWYKLLFTEDITPEMRKFPQYKYALMGLYDTLFNLMSTWPVPYLESSLVNVMAQSILPLNMIGSLIFLKMRFRRAHYLGAFLVMYGIFVKLLPTIFYSAKEQTAIGLAGGADSSHNQGAVGLWIMILFLSNIPATASNVYKEIGLKDTQSDIWYMNAWIGVYQFLFGLLTIPTIWIAWPKPATHTTPAELGGYLHDANQCFWGTNTRVGDHCSGTWFLFAIFLIFNVTYNQLMLYVFKKGSSVLFVIASAVRLPLVDFLLTSRFLAGPATSSISVYDVYSVLILVVGIVVYKSKKEEFGKYEKPAIEVDPTATPEFSPGSLLNSPGGGQGTRFPFARIKNRLRRRNSEGDIGSSSYQQLPERSVHVQGDFTPHKL